MAALRFKRVLAWTLLVLFVLATPLWYVFIAFLIGLIFFLLVRWLFSLYVW